MGFDALGALPLGGIPDTLAYIGVGYSGRWLGYIGTTRRPEDMPLEILETLDEDFDLDRAIALWLMMHNDT